MKAQTTLTPGTPVIVRYRGGATDRGRVSANYAAGDHRWVSVYIPTTTGGHYVDAVERRYHDGLAESRPMVERDRRRRR